MFSDGRTTNRKVAKLFVMSAQFYHFLSRAIYFFLVTQKGNRADIFLQVFMSYVNKTAQLAASSTLGPTSFTSFLGLLGTDLCQSKRLQ